MVEVTVDVVQQVGKWPATRTCVRTFHCCHDTLRSNAYSYHECVASLVVLCTGTIH